MSSKVVHLSTEAHTKAKIYCKSQGLKMSDWVASLIEAAIEAGGKLPQAAAPPIAAPPLPPAYTQASANAAARVTPARVQSAAAPVAARPAPASAPAPKPVAPKLSEQDKVRAFVPKKKRLEEMADGGESTETQEVPPWAAPPFWAQGK